MDILEKVNEMMQKIEDETKIFLISPGAAEKLVNTDAESSPNVLFMLINRMPENLAYSLEGDLKKDVLKQSRENLVKLYTLEELRRQ